MTPLRILPVPDQPQTDDDGPLLLSAKGLAALLSAGIRTIRTWDASGKLPKPLRVGGSVRWDADEIRSWIAAGCPDRVTWEKIKQTRRAK